LSEKSLTINSVEPLLLYGSNDSHLKKIESTFNSTKLVARGDTIHLAGSDEEIGKVEEVISELVALLKRNAHLTTNDVETVLSLVQKDSVGEFVSKSPDVVIVNTPELGAIKPAGTGKTYMAVAIAVSLLKTKRVTKIVLSRPAVEAGESLGYLPGDLKEKVDPYLTPLYDALRDMLSPEKLRLYLDNNTIEIVPLAYMRGRTLNNSFVILDEAQNATTVQMKMFLTRLGLNSKTIITGDMTQTDLPRQHKSGFKKDYRCLRRFQRGPLEPQTRIPWLRASFLKSTGIMRSRSSQQSQRTMLDRRSFAYWS